MAKIELTYVSRAGGYELYRAPDGRTFTYPVNEIKPGSLVMHERFPKVLWRVLGPATHAREPSFDVRNAEEATTRRYAGIHTFRVAELERVTDRCPKHKSYRGRTLPRSKCPGCWAVFDGRQ